MFFNPLLVCRLDAEKEIQIAAQELLDVQQVRQKIELEGGNDVLLRSLLREQSEADEAQKKAKATMAKANAMEQQGTDDDEYTGVD